MPFFIPERLISLEYLKSDTVDETYNKEAESYLNEIDFAFFVVNFGYSKADYNALTPTEKAFIYKAWEDKQICQSSLINKSFSNALANSFRKKNSRAIPLWKKKPMHCDKDKNKAILIETNEVEKKSDKSWVDKIYRANGMKKEVG